MTIPFKEPPKYYKDEDGLFYWMVCGDQLWQFCNGYFNQWHPGSDLHYKKMKQLASRVPISDSEAESVLRGIVDKINGFVFQGV